MSERIAKLQILADFQKEMEYVFLVVPCYLQFSMGTLPLLRFGFKKGRNQQTDYKQCLLLLHRYRFTPLLAPGPHCLLGAIDKCWVWPEANVDNIMDHPLYSRLHPKHTKARGFCTHRHAVILHLKCQEAQLEDTSLLCGIGKVNS